MFQGKRRGSLIIYTANMALHFPLVSTSHSLVLLAAFYQIGTKYDSHVV
jgi:hypothetical protein